MAVGGFLDHCIEHSLSQGVFPDVARRNNVDDIGTMRGGESYQVGRFLD